ncbi:hypothetical protein KVV02_004813 [Mortierella alpina]|uniref:NodB homology domain-containing protein n=1 Tax=Mortierella alpina TaxID=64518 RepID=A0A9P8A0N9_MORAP|nr:hypothetical protein KVV02_004813 [Mortierella alpina]
MRLKALVLVVSCLAISFTNAVTIPEISQLVGPLTDTPVPAPGSGSVTDPASTSFGTGTKSRLALYVPGNVYKDYPGWLAFYKALVFQGIPVTVTKNINVARTYATVVAYQSLQEKYLATGEGTVWANYVSSGKTLIAIGFNSTNSNLKSTFGITPDTVTNARNRTTLVLQAPSPAYPATSVNALFNQSVVNDVQLPLWSKTTSTGFPTIGYTLVSPTTAPYGVVALGKYILNGGAADTKTAITIKSRSNGGKAVAIGFDVGAYVGASIGGKTDGIPRTYVAKYDPGFDNIFRMIKKLYETSTPTGLVTSWPVPGNKGVHFSWTYDIDAQDSYELAYECAKDLQQRGMGGTINWQAKIVRDAYDVASFSNYYRNISLVEALGNMELASHSVSHSPNLDQFPIGTGKEIFNGPEYKGNNYYPFIGQCLDPTNTGAWSTIVPNATICETPNNSLYFYTVGGSLLGEARVSKFVLEAISITNAKVTSFRTGHLLYPDALPQVLQAAGFKYSSSGASNDRNTHMPYQAFYSQAYNQTVDILEFPLSASDEDGQINGDWYGPGEGTLQDGSYAYQQLEVLKKMTVYGGQYTFLIHPTTHAVPGVVASLFSDKLAFQQVFASKIGNLAYVDTMAGRGDFHDARIAAGIDVVVSGSTATVTVKLPKPIIDLTLRVPTAWAFATSTTAVKVTPGAVVLVNSVPAGTVKLTFKTSGTVTTTKAPPAGPAPTTTTIAMSTPTLPAPTPASTHPLVVDDFSDPQRYGNEENAIDVYTSDENSGSAKASVQADWLLLNVKDSTYWYSLLGPRDSCNDYSQFTQLNLAIRFPTATRFGFDVVLQEADDDLLLGCSSTEQTSYRFDASSMINSAIAGTDGWIQLNIDLGVVFGEVDRTKLRAVLLDSFSATGQLEIDYVRFS